MKTLIEAYGHLWPGAETKLAELFRDVTVAHYPEEKTEMGAVPQVQRQKTIVVAQGTSSSDIIQILDLQYTQIVQAKKSDFARELLVSAILLKKPKAFIEDPRGILLGTRSLRGREAAEKSSVFVSFERAKNKVSTNSMSSCAKTNNEQRHRRTSGRGTI